MNWTLLGIFDLAGTIAFAISGAFVGIHKRMDVFGVNVLADQMPDIFLKHIYALAAMPVACPCFCGSGCRHPGESPCWADL